jgi:hypothetical protein
MTAALARSKSCRSAGIAASGRSAIVSTSLTVSGLGVQALGELVAESLIVEVHQQVILLGEGGVVGAPVRVFNVGRMR